MSKNVLFTLFAFIKIYIYFKGIQQSDNLTSHNFQINENVVFIN